MLPKTSRDESTTVRCPGCGSPLVLHQPDVQRPDRLLGVCIECKSWYLLKEDGKEKSKLIEVGGATPTGMP